MLATRPRSSTMDSSTAYSCDTVPPPANPNLRELSPPPIHAPTSTPFDLTPAHDIAEPGPVVTLSPPGRKLCVRHQRMADEGTIVKLQASLDALPVGERETVSAIWATFSSSSHPRRELILQGILTMCCFSQLSLLSESLTNLIRLDPFVGFPREVSLKVLGLLDAISLGRAAQVNRHWRSLADDNVLWKSICEQHIDKQCRKCGWGLPLLERRRTVAANATPTPTPTSISQRPQIPSSPTPSSSSISSDSLKRPRDSDECPDQPPKRFRSASPSLSDSALSGPSTPTPSSCMTRLWKDVYCERLKIARNWKRGQYTVRTLKGHDDSVMCLQMSEHLPHVEHAVLITGSYDRTVRVWNMDTGCELRVLRGHARAVRALQFDEAKLITGSMDCTLRVWDWRTGRCIRILQGHSEGVVCLRYDSNVLASGSVDATVKVWNFRTGECFTLRGHKDWVNAVQLWQLPGTEFSASLPAITPSSGDMVEGSSFDIDPGKMLFSASDDCTIRLWDLSRKTCVRQFSGHVGQVQSLLLLSVDPSCGGTSKSKQDPENGTAKPALWRGGSTVGPGSALVECGLAPGTPLPHLVSGSLDNTIKTWDIETGIATQTIFGHIEGVWSVVGDRLRLASGSHDKTIKVWQREEAAPPLNLVGHEGPVTCLALSDDKIVSGSDDHSVKVWCFSPPS